MEQQCLDLDNLQKLEFHGFLAETPGWATVTENFGHLLFSQPPPALSKLADRRPLAALPDKPLDLIKGLVWQRSQRPPIGKLAQRWGWLTEQQVAEILSHRGPSRRFGQKAVELKLLQVVQVEALLFHQRSQQQRLGQFFVIRGLLNQR